MKVIGERVSILRKEDLLSIVILPVTDKKKQFMMFLWLFAWTVCGLIVLVNYPSIKEQNAKMFVIVYLSFWLYYEIKIARAFTWKKYGREKIWIKNGILHYQREIANKGKIKEYDLELVNDLKVVEINEGNFFDYINQSFWIKGGERLELSCQSKVVRFGMQLTDKEAKTVLNELSEFILKVLEKK
ncbi:MAG: hypothetical protein K0S12_1811 [Bacteroidetes bacterium]|jgi:hypothetical protein|nr:hypothetical protein [Bacteroidota bacterium]